MDSDSVMKQIKTAADGADQKSAEREVTQISAWITFVSAHTTQSIEERFYQVLRYPEQYPPRVVTWVRENGTFIAALYGQDLLRRMAGERLDQDTPKQ